MHEQLIPVYKSPDGERNFGSEYGCREDRIVEVRTYESVDDMVETTLASTKDPSKPLVTEYAHEWCYDNDKFLFGDINKGLRGKARMSVNCLEDVAAYARSEWQYGLELVEQYRHDLEAAGLPQPVSRRRVPRWSEDSGDELSMDRVYAGQPFWRECRRRHTRGPSVITLVVGCQANAHRDSKDIFWRGASAVALTGILEEAGYRVELWAAWKSIGSFYNDDSSLTLCCLKQPGDPVNESALANAVSGWFYRSFGFLSWVDSSRRLRKDYGLGHAKDVTCQDLSHVLPTTEGVYIIDECWNFNEARLRAGRVLAEVKEAAESHLAEAAAC